MCAGKASSPCLDAGRPEALPWAYCPCFDAGNASAYWSLYFRKFESSICRLRCLLLLLFCCCLLPADSCLLLFVLQRPWLSTVRRPRLILALRQRQPSSSGTALGSLSLPRRLQSPVRNTRSPALQRLARPNLAYGAVCLDLRPLVGLGLSLAVFPAPGLAA